jgi:hypothetical protein
VCDGTSAVGESRHRIRIRWSDEDLTARFAAGLHCSALVRKWHIAAPDVCDGTSESCAKADTAFQAHPLVNRRVRKRLRS